MTRSSFSAWRVRTFVPWIERARRAVSATFTVREPRRREEVREVKQREEVSVCAQEAVGDKFQYVLAF